ncbi:hypothetical protein Hanom_Chr00s003738g01715441 [Helianthus anomalus]
MGKRLCRQLPSHRFAFLPSHSLAVASLLSHLISLSMFSFSLNSSGYMGVWTRLHKGFRGYRCAARSVGRTSTLVTRKMREGVCG